MKIDSEDLKIELVYPDPRGGQHAGSPRIDVKLTHIPTQISASCGFHKSQHRNKGTALSMIEWALVEIGYSDPKIA